MKSVELPVRGHLDLDLTFRSGQVFRWRILEDGPSTVTRTRSRRGAEGKGKRPDAETPALAGTGRYCGVISGSSVILEKKSDCVKVFFDPAVSQDAGKLRTSTAHYLALDENQAEIEEELASKHPVLGELVRVSPGFRILRQDPWECLASFILSAHNNIPAIERTIDNLSAMLGTDAGFGRRTFPSPQAVLEAGEPLLAQAKCGFRGKYLWKTAEKVLSGEVDLESVRAMPAAQGRAELMKLPGVGRKVADCTLLFAYHKLEVFPVDVWVKRAMAQLFPETESLLPERIADEGGRLFGRYAGYAQE